MRLLVKRIGQCPVVGEAQRFGQIVRLDEVGADAPEEPKIVLVEFGPEGRHPFGVEVFQQVASV